MIADGKSLTTRGMYYYARELKDNNKAVDAANAFQSFLNTNQGWVEDNITACSELSKCYLSQNEDQRALSALFQSFIYDTPRAEICCEIGYYFKDKKKYRQAVYWFETALRLKKPSNSWGFIREDCWGFIPSIECAVCYDQLMEIEQAEIYNEMAAKFKPEAPSIIYNRKYFAHKKNLQSVETTMENNEAQDNEAQDNEAMSTNI